jgi:uncharacterized protein YehS (DUF1456 family)
MIQICSKQNGEVTNNRVIRYLRKVKPEEF